jgi:tetratricopeptide (TPR) repeat protein
MTAAVSEPDPQPDAGALGTTQTAVPREGLLFGLALALVAAVHAGALQAPFIWDDHPLIVEEIIERRRPLLEYLFQPFWRASEAGPAFRGYVRPLTTLSYVLDARWSGGNAVAFHATNLLAHLVVLFLLGRLARRFGATPLASAIAMLAVGCAPRLTESVTWISGRTDVLAALFGLAAVSLHPLHAFRREFGRPRLRAWTAAALMLLALGAKEVAIAFVALIVADEALDVLRRRSAVRQAFARLLPTAVSLLAYLALRARTSTWTPSDQTHYGGARALFSLEALGRYAVMLIDFARPRTQIGDVSMLSWIHVLVGACTLVGLVVVVVRFAPRLYSSDTLQSDGALLGFLLCLAAVFPVLHVLPMPMNVVAADRFLYVPGLGLALAGACLASRRPLRHKRIAGAAVVGLLATAACATVVRERCFRSELAFWLAATDETDPSNVLPLRELAGVVYRGGEFGLAEQAFEAIVERTLARTDLPPGSIASPLTDLADVYSALGDYARAQFFSERMLELGAGAPRQAFNAALVQLHRENFEQVAELCRQALAMLPDYPDARSTLLAIPELVREREALASGRADPLRRARYFRNIGARLKAQNAFVEVLEHGPPDGATRDEALAYLVTYGDTDVLLEALRRYPTDNSTINDGAALRRSSTLEIRAHASEIMRYVAKARSTATTAH